MVLTTLFTGMGIVTIILLIVGVILTIMEMFTPGFGLFGTLGVGCLISSLVTRLALDKSDQPVAHFFLMLLFILIVLSIAFVTLAILAKKGKLDNTFFIEKNSAVPVGITEGTRDYTELVGKVGVVVAPLRPIGVAVIDGERRDVETDGEFIVEGAKIKVKYVEGVHIVVCAAPDEE